MQPMLLDFARQHPFRILCLGAHCDDIEIGCGGTLLRLLDTVPDLQVHWAVFTGSPLRKEEAKASSDAFLAGAAARRVDLLSFRESFLPQQWGAVKEEFERIKAQFNPSLVLTHVLEDRHQDHRTIAELTWNTFRDHMIWEYEIPKFEGDLARPNVYVPVNAEQAGRKVELLSRHYPSQHGRAWFDEHTFLGLMRIRGVGCNAPSGYAEGFVCRKAVV